MNTQARRSLSVPSPANNASSTSLKSAPKTTQPPPEAAVLRDRQAVQERTFITGTHSKDAFAEEMGEDAVRALTSANETDAERGDESSELSLDDVTFVSDEDTQALEHRPLVSVSEK